MLTRWARVFAGLGLGALAAFVELAYLVAGGFALAASSRRMDPGARRLADRARHRVARWYGPPEIETAAPESWRVWGYLGARAAVGLLGGCVLVLFGYGAVVSATVVVEWVTGGRPDGIDLTLGLGLYFGVLVVVLFFLALQGFLGLVNLERRLVRRFLGPSPDELLRRRISELAESRAGIVEAVDAERRRIERDIHDGVQQRVVALAMLLGRARRTSTSEPERVGELLAAAHDESQRVLGDLRDVAWRVYPTALDSLGLSEALAAVAERSSVPVTLDYRLAERPEPTVETAAYFVVCEAVTNAAKHSGAGAISVVVQRNDTLVTVCVSDDGRGGADPSGHGLSGLARRVAAIDGVFTVDSPASGPTVITAELPCA
ncbi:signal transduction histidine kinase [Herbihabitans rhizosphaerae]|uniref:histidine kinase n=1 Tax=Herbihabitans rhizosphaerae TaxID=1872711 RepID=A0A4Q7KRB2_9PSEU|nr:histidine kinase [Herbihabitans rhizosphaerae]RZS38936.1 signal transduction histidine kinase [Herbihabitans rhizosphaerae]